MIRAISRREDLHGLPRNSPSSRERCVSPTSATDFRHEHPVRCQIPDLAPLVPHGPPRLSTLRVTWPSGPRIAGGASLDGDSPASASLQPIRLLTKPRSGSSPESSAAQIWRASIEGSSARRLPLGALSTTRRACSSASDVLFRAHLARTDLSIDPALTCTWLRFLLLSRQR